MKLYVFVYGETIDMILTAEHKNYMRIKKFLLNSLKHLRCNMTDNLPFHCCHVFILQEVKKSRLYFAVEMTLFTSCTCKMKTSYFVDVLYGTFSIRPFRFEKDCVVVVDRSFKLDMRSIVELFITRKTF